MPEKISIVPRFRASTILILAMFDLSGTVAASDIYWSDAIMRPWVIAISSVILLGGQICGLYAVESSNDLQRSARGVIAICAGLLPGALLAGWFIGGPQAAWHMALSLAVGGGTAMFARFACALGVQKFANTMIEQVLVVGTCRTGERLIRSAFSLVAEVRIVGQIVVGDGEPCVPLIGRIGTGDAVGRYLISEFSYPNGSIDRVLVLKPDMDERQLNNVVRCLEALSAPVHLLTDLPNGDRSTVLPDGVEWIVRGTPLRPGARLIKRSLDLIASSVLIVLLAPLGLLICMFICMETPGPPLFRQTRLGRHNQPFAVLKFRTMHADADGKDGSIQAVRGDTRVTRIGTVLRKTSLDELPQLLNVFAGTMSLVGPRPHPTDLNQRFVPLIESYTARHRVLPGITGWAQVNGFRGETSTIDQMQGRINHDLEYIREHSVIFDLWILLRTLVVIVVGRNAY